VWIGNGGIPSVAEFVAHRLRRLQEHSGDTHRRAEPVLMDFCRCLELPETLQFDRKARPTAASDLSMGAAVAHVEAVPGTNILCDCNGLQERN
jgi:hypothetical protein